VGFFFQTRTSGLYTVLLKATAITGIFLLNTSEQAGCPMAFLSV